MSKRKWGKLVTGSISYHRWLYIQVLFLPFSPATSPQECHRHLNMLTFVFCSFFCSILFPFSTKLHSISLLFLWSGLSEFIQIQLYMAPGLHKSAGNMTVVCIGMNAILCGQPAAWHHLEQIEIFYVQMCGYLLNTYALSALGPSKMQLCLHDNLVPGKNKVLVQERWPFGCQRFFREIFLSHVGCSEISTEKAKL